MLAVTLSNACTEKTASTDVVAEQEDPFPSTYAPAATDPVLLENATLLTGTGMQLDNTSILLVDGKISALGQEIDAPESAVIIDASGKWITPGLIDVHSHLGVYPAPSHEANLDGNEVTNPNTAQVYAEHSVWTQ
ncbi:MAG: amidohydrolase, partial [Gammaproteobacteria bacterium]|nr:amidohydrolase [Gammaproteobacteria bacterium]